MQNVASKKAIYDIGAEIINFHCFYIMEAFLFSKSMIFGAPTSQFRALSFGSLKTRFKAIFEKNNFRTKCEINDCFVLNAKFIAF